MIFIIGVIVVYIITYFVLYYIVPYFFEQTPKSIDKRSVYSVCIIVLLTALILVLSSTVGDVEIGNRLLHALGGGFIVFIVYLLAVRDSGLQVNLYRLLIFGVLIITALGVLNELMEFIVQHYTTFIFADNIYDTWLDLTSNTVGILLGVLVSPLFIRR